MASLLSLAKGLPLLASCAFALAVLPAMPDDLTTPVQQRIAIKDPNAISIGWNTYGPIPGQACVHYGTSPDSLDSLECSDSSVVPYGTSKTYSNTVTLSGLTPATTYYYKIRSTNSTVEHFFSPRVPGDKTPFAVNAVIDLGLYGADNFTIGMDMSKRYMIPDVQPAPVHTTIERLAASIDDYELVLHPGDLAYADDWICPYFKGWLPACSVKALMHNPSYIWAALGSLFKTLFWDLRNGNTHNAFQAILESFYDQLAPITARKPYMVGPGNHEATCSEVFARVKMNKKVCPEGQRNFTDFQTRFGQTMPTAFASTSADLQAQANADKARTLANPPFWYSFEYGMVHFVMIDTETDFASAPDETWLESGPFGVPHQQLEFLEADLASVDRTVTPWVVVSGHRPWYTSGEVCAACQLAFEPLLYKYGVDLAVLGHVHNSQRFQPVYAGEADPKGLDDPTAPMYIVAGGAGNIEGLDKVKKLPKFAAFAYADGFSYGKIKFLDENRLQVDFIRSSTGETLDSSVLYKSHKEQFVVQS
ncbi:acid phosphatase [Apiospora rasikravindrae]|uniref:Purple acid phosphatase n=1 Tax=Apiospora rasikravindrae TaxID=990691 RepID=A0ABR1U0X2_9PEZI